MNSPAYVMKAEITIPDFSSIVLPRQILTKAMEPGSLVIVDPPGLKVYGKEDGAYDGEPVSQAVLNKQPNVQVMVPPHENEVCSDAGDTQRNQHIQAIAEQGSMVWERKRGYTCATM